LGEDFNVFQSTAIAVQTDLFGNAVNTPEKSKPKETPAENIAAEKESGFNAEKNISNTPHNYHLADTPEKINELITALSLHTEICFDTETTGIDPNDAALVGMSFSTTPHEAYYIPFPADETLAQSILQLVKPLFENERITWIGQNIKYDMLVLKWYNIELKGKIYDTMLAHYVIEPEGRRSMDLLSAQYLGYEPVHIEELIGKKGKTQGNMRDVPVEKIKDYAAEDADITLQLKHSLHPLLQAREVEKVFL